jgi:MFS family permease
MYDFNISEVGVSSLSAMFFFGYIVWLIPAGLMLDHLGSRKSILFAYLALGSGCLIFGYTSNPIIAMIGRLMMGVGSSFAFINLLYVINLWFPFKKFSSIAGFGESFSILMATIGAILLPVGISHFGWRFIILSSGWLSVALFVITFLILKNNIREINRPISDEVTVIKAFIRLIKHKELWLLGVYGLCIFSLISVFSSLWGVPFFSAAYHYDIKIATTAVMMVPFGAGVGCLFAGFVISNFKNKSVMLTASITCTILMSLVIYLPTVPYYILLLLLFLCGFFSATYIQSYTIAQKTYSEKSYGCAISIITIIIMGGAAIFQMFIGWLLDTNFFKLAGNEVENFQLSFLTIPLCLLIAFFMASKINSE